MVWIMDSVLMGRECELLKTINTRISLHLPQIRDVLAFSELINNSCVRLKNL